MLLADRIRTKPAAAWLAEPGLEGGVGPVHEPVDLIEDPQLIGRGSLVSLPRSGDKVFANPIRFESADGSTASHGLSDPPELGEHTVRPSTFPVTLEPVFIQKLPGLYIPAVG